MCGQARGGQARGGQAQGGLRDVLEVSRWASPLSDVFWGGKKTTL